MFSQLSTFHHRPEDSSLVVHPAAGFPARAKQNGARLIILNRDPTPLDPIADLVLHAEIGPTLSAAIGC